jgi:hypothetical protein
MCFIDKQRWTSTFSKSQLSAGKEVYLQPAPWLPHCGEDQEQ